MNEIRSCRYRTPEELTCAIGCLIPKEEYKSEFEGNSARALLHLDFPDQFTKLPTSTHRLLQALQYLHDDRAVDLWKSELLSIAKSSSLNTGQINSFYWNEELQRYVHKNQSVVCLPTLTAPEGKVFTDFYGAKIKVLGQSFGPDKFKYTVKKL